VKVDIVDFGSVDPALDGVLGGAESMSSSSKDIDSGQSRCLLLLCYSQAQR